MVHHPTVQRCLSHASIQDTPLAIDVGYGASHTTTCEWAIWLRRLRADVSVLGLEIDPARVLPPRDGVHFAVGGFELAGHRPRPPSRMRADAGERTGGSPARRRGPRRGSGA